ncbi:MAG: hypothetical protein JAY67_22595 [Candidatus Thiodiazotropha taylori]|nr:hypothetical protein [Candidatus Thiodiazotropha taylori]MCG7973341.1 hypothetical protein [Candidatus Thiodiazotropha taylori]
MKRLNTFSVTIPIYAADQITKQGILVFDPGSSVQIGEVVLGQIANRSLLAS